MYYNILTMEQITKGEGSCQTYGRDITSSPSESAINMVIHLMDHFNMKNTKRETFLSTREAHLTIVS